MKPMQTTIALFATTIAALLGITAIEGNFATHILPGQSAEAGIFDGIADRIIPSGMYFEIDGRKFYFGEYSERGDDAIVFKGSKWEIKYGGKVAAHGYGQTPGWVVDLARRFFKF